VTNNPNNSNDMSDSFLSNTPSVGALVNVESSRAIQEVQAALIIAKRFPRDERQAIDRILNSCSRQTLAETALYTYSRGGTDITGPSIRLAEALAQNWGNIQFGIRELEQSNGESTVEAFAWDVETNTRQTKVFQVRHERHTRNGVKELSDPRDVYELVANQGARRLRACILGILPGDVVEQAVSQCETTLTAKADTSPEAQKKILNSFEGFGITKGQIETLIQRRIDAITPALVVRLRKIYESLKDGIGKPEDWFKPEVGAANVPTNTAPVDNGDSKPAKAPVTRRKTQDAPKPQEEAEDAPGAAQEGRATDPVARAREAIASEQVAEAAPVVEREAQDDEIPGLGRNLQAELVFAVKKSGKEWTRIAQVADEGGVFIDGSIPPNEQPDDVITDLLSVWPSLLANA
jgi:hypothetical protein